MSEKSRLLGEFIGIDPRQWAMEHGYPMEAILAVGDDHNTFKIMFPDLLDRLQGNTNQLDDRSPWEFIHNIALSWITEDFTLECLHREGMKINSFGDQQERDFTRTVIKGDPDFILNLKWADSYIELIQTYTNYWVDHGRYDLRHNKLSKMKALADGGSTKSLILGLDIKNKRFFLHNIEDKEPKGQVMSNTFHKKTSRMEVHPRDFMDWDPRAVKLEIFHQVYGY